MKNIKHLLVLAIAFPFFLASCLKEDNLPAPSVNSVKMYMTGIDGKDSLISEAKKGKSLKFVVETNAEMCTIWPGGIRTIMKKKGTAIDSLDMYNHPVLIKSDCHIDYGLVGARGFKGTQTDGGWYVSYSYPNAGSFDLTVIVTNHGYDGPEYNQVVVNGGDINVK